MAKEKCDEGLDLASSLSKRRDYGTSGTESHTGDSPDKPDSRSPTNTGQAKDPPKPDAMHFDDLMKILGEFGRFQKIRFFLLCLFSIMSAWHALNMVFVGAKPDFHCKVSDLNLSGTSLENISDTTRRAIFLPGNDKCSQYDIEETVEAYSEAVVLGNSSDVANVTARLVPCRHGYEFSREEYQETITTEFTLVCDRKFWISTSKSIFFGGRLFGAVVFGQLSDRFGRRPMFFVGVVMLLIAGTVASFAPNIYVFLPMYFCQGAAHTGTFLVAYTMATELVGPRYRVMAGFISQTFYSIGFMSLAGIAYFIRDWRYLEIAITVPAVLFGLYYWVLPESVRWLLSKGRDQQAEEILQQAARTNGVTLTSDVIQSLKQNQNQSPKGQRQYYLLDCVRTWNMARLSLNVWFNWLVNALVYYGLSLNTENLAGNPYLNFCVAGAVEVPAYILCILFLNKVGRRWPLILSMYVGGVACILSGCIPTAGSPTMEVVTVILAMIGKFGITASYGIVYLMAAEVFPTVIRNIGMGVASMSARIGGILAPLILDLSTFSAPLPLIVFGGLSLLAGSLAILLPETKGKPLPQLPEDTDYGKSCTSLLFCLSKRDNVKLDHEMNPQKT